MMKSPTEVNPANLNIVPYYVAKNPSDPSLITTAISCIALGPSSLFRISQSIHILIPINNIENTQALNDTKLEVELDMIALNKTIITNGAANNEYFSTSLCYRPVYL